MIFVSFCCWFCMIWISFNDSGFVCLCAATNPCDVGLMGTLKLCYLLEHLLISYGFY